MSVRIRNGGVVFVGGKEFGATRTVRAGAPAPAGILSMWSPYTLDYMNSTINQYSAIACLRAPFFHADNHSGDKRMVNGSLDDRRSVISLH